jgi:hypothetical protein
LSCSAHPEVPVGVVKVVATTIFIFFGVETLGRKLSFFISAMGMGTLFYIIGAILKTHPPPVPPPPTPPPASQAMAGMLYIYVVFYSMGWGELLPLYQSVVDANLFSLKVPFLGSMWPISSLPAQGITVLQ